MVINNEISFGHKISTQTLLRAGSGAMNFEDAKLLNNEIGVKYSGHIGFIKRANDIVQKIAQKDKNIAEIFKDLQNTQKKLLETKIRRYTEQLGEKLDIEI